MNWLYINIVSMTLFSFLSYYVARKKTNFPILAGILGAIFGFHILLALTFVVVLSFIPDKTEIKVNEE